MGETVKREPITERRLRHIGRLEETAGQIAAFAVLVKSPPRRRTKDRNMA
jgi:hypothetical protein